MSTSNLYRVTQHGLRVQAALRQMLIDAHHTHWVTLNFHTEIHKDAAHATLRLWSLDVTSRLFRKGALAVLPLADLFHFVAFPEFTAHQHPHFHMYLYLHSDRRQWFARCAGRLWKRVAPKGTADIQVIRPTECDRIQVIHYGTKHAARRFSNENFITSNMLDLPQQIRAGTPSIDS